MSLNTPTATQRRGMQRRNKRRLTLSVFTLLTLVLGLLAGPIAAQNASDNRVDFEVLQVDVSNSTGTIVVRPQAQAEAGEIIVEIEGEEIAAATTLAARSTVTTNTVLVVDDSTNANSIVGFENIRAAALAYVDGLSANTRVMLMRGGGGRVDASPVVGFTGDHDAIRSAINAMEPSGGGIAYNAIANGAALLSGQGDGIRQVVAVVGSTAENSTRTATEARGRLLGAGASFTVVAPDTANLDISGYSSIADNLRGGVVFRATDDVDFSAAARNAAAVHQSYLVGQFSTAAIIPSTSADGEIVDGTNELVASYSGASERVRIVQNGVAFGPGLDAGETSSSSRFSILQGNLVAMIAIALVVVAVLIFAFTLMMILFGTDNSLNSTLSVYGAQDARTDEQSAADDAFARQRSKIIEQVVERAEEAAEARGNLNTTANLLEKAEIPLRVGEAFAVQVGIVIFAFIIGFFVFGTNLLGGLLLAIPAALLPPAFVRHKVAKRAKKLESQLPDTLTLLASTLKAGYSFLQGMDAVGNEAEEPLAGEFRRTVNEARLGKEMDDALDDLSDRVESQDMLWAIVAIKIQREVGGNLAELLTIVAETMNQRQRLRGEVRALTAEGRISAYVLLALPFLVALGMWFLNPEYLSELWTNTMGIVLVIVAMISMVIGGFWMRKIVDIEL